MSGGFPYPTLGDRDILPFLLKGDRLDRPENCTNDLYSLMTECWSHHCDKRPQFKAILEYLDYTKNKRAYVDFSHLNPSYVFPPTEEIVPESRLEVIKRNLNVECAVPGSNKVENND